MENGATINGGQPFSRFLGPMLIELQDKYRQWLQLRYSELTSCSLLTWALIVFHTANEQLSRHSIATSPVVSPPSLSPSRALSPHRSSTEPCLEPVELPSTKTVQLSPTPVVEPLCATVVQPAPLAVIEPFSTQAIPAVIELPLTVVVEPPPRLLSQPPGC